MHPTLQQRFLSLNPKRVVLSGPSGFLGSRVLDAILRVHALREQAGVPSGEVILLSSSPGNLMGRLVERYASGGAGDRGAGATALRSVRASRVDYYTQHQPSTWVDHLGSLGVRGPDSVFVNLAGVAGPIKGRGAHGGQHDVNYAAVVAAAAACEELGVGHFVQSSTQATNAERAGQVPYSRGKAMADFSLSQVRDMPVTIACLGLLYCKADVVVGQQHGRGKMNLIDLSVLPLTPIMGSGRAPLQPQEVEDAAIRIAYLALCDPAADRPQSSTIASSTRLQGLARRAVAEGGAESPALRIYDAVGPETMSIIDLLQRFARYQGNASFRPVHTKYRHMESILNVRSLGNLNRQFVSLLRSEQDDDQLKAAVPVIGDARVWDALDAALLPLTTLDESFPTPVRRSFPLLKLVEYVVANPRVVPPGLLLGAEILTNAVAQGVLTPWPWQWGGGVGGGAAELPSSQEQAARFLRAFGGDGGEDVVTEAAVEALRAEFDLFDKGGRGELAEEEAMLLLKARVQRHGWRDETTHGGVAHAPAAGGPAEAHDGRSFKQLRVMVSRFDADGNGRLSFEEWACVVFDKSFEEVHGPRL